MRSSNSTNMTKQVSVVNALWRSLATIAITLTVSLSVTACGGGGGSDAATDSATNAGGSPSTTTGGAPAGSQPTTSPTGTASTQNPKRGVAYDFASPDDLAAVSSTVSWWYNWSATPNAGVPSDYATRYHMQFIPMLWNGNFNDASIVAYLRANPSIKYMLVLNEPNLVDQADMTPSDAAALWPRYEAIAAQTGVKIVGPAMNWGTLPGYADPVVWLDEFYADYQAANGGRSPQIDYLAFHWYDYGLASQLDALDKYGKQIWVTEFANWHSANDGAQIDTLAAQQAQMQDMVNTCETRADVFRYAWFTGRLSPDPHFTSLLGANGQLTGLGQQYAPAPAQ